MPSTLMEYFASDPRVLQSIGRHYKTGEKLPMNTLERYCAARKIFAGVDLQMQTFYSIMDQVCIFYLFCFSCQLSIPFYRAIVF